MKTVIVGNSGSGKSWLAGRLADVEGGRVVHLDHIFWQPGGFDLKRAPEEVSRMIEEERSSPSWIVEGVFGELAKPFLQFADRLVWLDIEWSICRDRLAQRGSESKAHGDREQSRAGLAKLVEWAATYTTRQDARSFVGHDKLFRAFPRERVHLRSEAETTGFVAAVRERKDRL